MEKRIIFNVSELQDGAVQEKIDYAVNEVFENIHDLNTDAGIKRSVTVNFSFTANDNREVVDVIAKVSNKLAPQAAIGTTMLTGRNVDTGYVEAKELGSGVPGQTFIDDDGELKTDVGEAIDEEGKVIDFNQRRNSN